MQETIENPLENVFQENEIPKKLHNIELGEIQRERLLKGLETGLIKGMVFEDGSVENVKVKAIRDKAGNPVLSYSSQKEELSMPSSLLGKKLTEEQVQNLYNGELLHLNYKRKDYYVGIDFELNRITVKNDREIAVPKEFGNYSLDGHDKQRLANGKATREHLFTTKNGNHYTASISLTHDKKGIVLENIKDVPKERAQDLAQKLNGKMEPEKHTTLGDITNEIADSIDLQKPIAQNKETDKQKGGRKGFKVLDISEDKGTKTLVADKVITPKTFHGTTLSDQQRADFEAFKKVELHGVTNKHSGKVQNVTIWKDKDINAFKMEWKPIKSPSKNISISKEL